jgi:hypothetical protein
LTIDSSSSSARSKLSFLISAWAFSAILFSDALLRQGFEFDEKRGSGNARPLKRPSPSRH